MTSPWESFNDALPFSPALLIFGVNSVPKEKSMETTIERMALPNGTFTLTNGNGEHRTLRIRTQKDDAKFAPGSRLISLLTGPDNYMNYTNFGFVNGHGKVKVWASKLRQNKHGEPSSTEHFFEKIAHMLWAMANAPGNNTYEERGCELKQSRKCVICNRKLTDPTSIDMGTGPICRGKGGG